MNLTILGIAGVAALTQGCDLGTSSRFGDTPTTPPSPQGVALAERETAELFGWDSVPTFEATLPKERWALIKMRARDELYEPAELRFEGKALGTVGLRFKGGVGTLGLCVDEQGNLSCAKLSMKIRFDEYRADTRFFRLKRLNLHSMVRDDSKLRERLGYDLFRELEILAPRSAWAVLTVNGESLGLFSMVEQVDGRFMAERFPEAGNGNLYKEAWPIWAEPSYYEEHLQTDPQGQEAAEHTIAAELGAELSTATEPVEQHAVLGRYMAPDYLARYMAVDDAIVNVDGVTAMYTGDNPRYYQNHNYYIYLEQQKPRFWLIPWDLDATFAPRPEFDQVPRWDALEADCSKSHTVWGGARVVSPACDPVFQAMTLDREGYRSAVDNLLSGPFSEETLKADIDRHAAFIESAVASDPTGPGLSSWQASVTALKQRIPLLRARLLSLKEGRVLSPFLLSVDPVNDFENADSESVTLGAVPLSNPHSSVNASLNAMRPLFGEQDLRLDFVYRNEGDPPKNPWGQWIYFSLRLEGAPRALSALSGIRLLLRADSPRILRIDLDSVGHEAPDEGIKFGWEVPIDSTAKQVEVRFSDASLPSWSRPTTDNLSRVLDQVDGIAFHPYCAGRDSAGFLPPDGADPGFLQIDQIEFF